MGYEPKDIPSFKKFRKDLQGFDAILRINKLLSKIGLGSEKLNEVENKFEEIKQQQKELQDYPTKFNRYFSAEGWIAHESLDFKLIKAAVNLHEQNKVKEAHEYILRCYAADEIEKRLYRFRAIPEFQSRMRFIDLALNDYKEGRYYSCIPILIMIIDGLVQDSQNIGFHAQEIDLNIWDSITSTETGIQVIKDIFQKSRNKTTQEKISLPYRHGILHGRDLGYDNHEVAAKSWAFLFYIRDWLLGKSSEKARIQKFEEENKKVTWRELFAQIGNLEVTKKALKAWKPRNISQEYLDLINRDNYVNDNSPEKMVLSFLEYWKDGNYGLMANCFSSLITENYKKYAGELRMRFEGNLLTDYSIASIEDEAASITEIIVNTEFNDGTRKATRFRCLYEAGKNKPIVRGLGGGEWKIVILE